jgi:hypothetical protein
VIDWDTYSHKTDTCYAVGCRRQACVDRHNKMHRDLRKKARSKTPPKHDASSYVYYGCRCEVCSTDMKRVSAISKAKRRERALQTP